MTANRTAELISRLPRWFVQQARAVDEQARRRQQEWEAVRRRNDALAKRAELEFICNVEVKDSGWDEWQDTMAEFTGQ